MVDTIKTYKLSATAYQAKYHPTLIGRNHHGAWYEHPIFGDEAPLILFTKDNRVHLTDSFEIED